MGIMSRHDKRFRLCVEKSSNGGTNKTGLILRDFLIIFLPIFT
jgi:hypothetical protein